MNARIMLNYGKLQCFRRAFTSKNRLEYLQELIGTSKVRGQNITKYTSDWTGNYAGGSIVCFPSSTKDVSEILKFCNEHRLPVVPQGGNTSLVGGSVGQSDEVIISLEKMNQIHAIDVTAGHIECDAGCIVQDVNEEAQKKNLIFPIDLTPKGSCMIGGIISTNAGGMRVLRYGSLHHNVLGLEVVLPDGTVLDMMRGVHKDNCGYHLKHLFIGAEGTLGIVTKAIINLYPLPRSTNVILMKASSQSKIPQILAAARASVGEILSAFEVMDTDCMRLVQDRYPQQFAKIKDKDFIAAADRSGNGEEAGYILLETSSGADESDADRDRLEKFLEPYLESEVISSAVISYDKSQELSLWNIRETLPLCLRPTASMSMTFNYKYDVSLPVTQWRAFQDEVGVRMMENTKVRVLSHGVRGEVDDICMRVYCFGHAGDQNLHYNVLMSYPPDTPTSVRGEVKGIMDTAVYEGIIKRHGSVSAEHGIGVQKSHLMNMARSAPEIDLMRSIKRQMDPHNIMNPGKVLPQS